MFWSEIRNAVQLLHARQIVTHRYFLQKAKLLKTPTCTKSFNVTRSSMQDALVNSDNKNCKKVTF